MAKLVSDLNWILAYFFNIGSVSDSSRGIFLQRIVDFIVSDPLILAVIAMFFSGFIVSIFVRIYHSS